MDQREIKKKVDDLLRECDVYEAPIPVEKIAQHLGIEIVGVPIPSQLSGALIRENGNVGITVNSTHHLHRQRFTIAHELGHFSLDHDPKVIVGEDSHVDWTFTILRRDGLSSSALDKKEIEANQFAAELLMPEELIKSEFAGFARNIGDQEITPEQRKKLAKRFKVSETALTYRLLNLGLLDPS